MNFPFPKFRRPLAPLSLQPLACLHSVYVLESEKGTFGHKLVGYLQSLGIDLDPGLPQE